jgi:FtsZ-binding cell division protein ZapB
MPAGRNIQVYGIDAVLQCYENNKIAAWAIVCDKNVNAKYTDDSHKEGYEMLQQYLDMLKKYDSAATYSLRLYEDVDKVIRSNTPYDIAFNFSLRDKDEPAAASNLPALQGMNTTTLTQLLREISDLKTENAVLKMEQDQAEDYIEELEKQLKQPPVAPEKTMGAALLEKFTPLLVSLGENFAGSMFKGKETALSGVPVSEQDEQALIDESVKRLKSTCTKYTVGQVLHKIADISENDPGQFDFYLKMLMK